jgi:hypothetical protein
MSRGISEMLIYIGAIIFILATIYMAVSRKKKFDDEDITD